MNYVQNIVSSCAQSVHAIRTLRAHGMCQEDTQTVFRSAVVAKLTYIRSQRLVGFFYGS